MSCFTDWCDCRVRISVITGEEKSRAKYSVISIADVLLSLHKPTSRLGPRRIFKQNPANHVLLPQNSEWEPATTAAKGLFCGVVFLDALGEAL